MSLTTAITLVAWGVLIVLSIAATIRAIRQVKGQ